LTIVVLPMPPRTPCCWRAGPCHRHSAARHQPGGPDRRRRSDCHDHRWNRTGRQPTWSALACTASPWTRPTGRFACSPPAAAHQRRHLCSRRPRPPIPPRRPPSPRPPNPPRIGPDPSRSGCWAPSGSTSTAASSQRAAHQSPRVAGLAAGALAARCTTAPTRAWRRRT
jgi:hypothetical protein